MIMNRIRKAFLCALTIALVSGAGHANIYFENTGLTNGWTTLWHEDQGSLLETNNPTYKGPSAVRCRTVYRSTYRGRYHTELRKGGMAALGMDRFYGFAFYLPANWEFDDQSYNIQQFIASVDGCSGGQPATMTHLYGRSLITRIVTGPDGCTRTSHPLTVTTNVTPGVWHTIVFHGNWQATNTGVFEFWYDGVRKVNQQNVETIPNDNTVFNLAVGNYSNGWHDDGTNVGTQTIRDVYIDHVRVADSYAEADPTAWSGPADGGQFALSINTSADSLTQGSNIVYNVLVVPFNGFSSNVTLSIHGVPTNVTATFNPAVVTPTHTSTLTLTAASNAVPGNYTLSVIGTGGSQPATNTLILTIVPAAAMVDTFVVATDNAWVLRSAGTTAETVLSPEVLQVKRLADSNTRISYLRFNLATFLNSHSAASLAQAKLHLYIPTATASAGSLSVYGLRDNFNGANGVDAAWTSTGMTWNNQPAKSASPNDISTSSTSLPNTNTTVLLGSTGIPGTAGEMIVTLDLTNAINFLTNDSNGQVTLLFVNSASTIVSFASIANTGSYPQPTLELVCPLPDFSIALSPAQQSMTTGTNATFTVTVTASNGFTGNVALSLDDVPPGLSAHFTPASINGSGSATLTLAASADMTPDNYALTVAGAGGNAGHTAGVSLAVTQLDSDGDGIPDVWMMQYFGHPTGQAGDQSLADGDADGDGMPNWVEFASSTDPTDGASYLHLVNVASEGNDRSISWTAVGGVGYVVQSSTNLVAGFNDISPVIVATADGTNSYIHTGAATNSSPRFYRIRVQP